MLNNKNEILKKFELFSGGTGGIDNWLSKKKSDEVLNRLTRIEDEPLSREQMNQLLILSHEAGVSPGFFKYYWLTNSPHPYDITSIPDYQAEWFKDSKIQSLNHLRWGLYQLYIDSLMFFGNIRTGYRYLRNKTEDEIKSFFQSKMYNTADMVKRGNALPLVYISKDNRYLISEMAYASYGSNPETPGELKKVLLDAWQDHKKRVGGKAKVRELLTGTYIGKKKFEEIGQKLLFSAEEILDYEIKKEQDIETNYTRIANIFFKARNAALQNTDYYLSMVDDLDVYVATSMRNRDDFRKMADLCEKIFSDERIKELNLRYFDPTLSAADGHEDKGLIECLMVKTAKVLIYFAGDKESYGKDAEAAMALSLGKPVIFLCNKKDLHFYRDLHPLSRLINFDTGVAVGAMITYSTDNVVKLLYRIFNNKMEYELEQPKPGYLRLKERLTESVVRLQTNNALLRETFWNYYDGKQNGVKDIYAKKKTY